jgi:hypothetical protein
MLSFKQYFSAGYSNLTEELNPAQKKVVDTWKGGKKAEQISGHVIPKGQDKVTFPLEGSEEHVEPHPDIQKHLEQHGYKVSDYKAGLAKDKYDRDVKIGKVLGKTKASPELMNTFNNDPKRAASRASASGLHVTISRHPHDVAGMSTNQGWRSCMSMGKKGQTANQDYDDDEYGKYDTGQDEQTGQYSHYLKGDVQHGTHVAYLHRSDDPEAKKPLARIALKPFEAEGKSKPTILRPEQRTYGTADDGFGGAVKKWAEKHFPADKNTVYKKNEDLYDDDNRNIVADGPNALFKSDDQNTRAAAFDHEHDVSDALLHKGVKDHSNWVAEKALEHPNIKPEHIDAAMKYEDLHPTLARRKNLSPEHVKQLSNSKSTSVLTELAMKHKLSPEKNDELLNHRNAGVREMIAKHQNLSKDQLDKAMSDKEFIVRGAAATNKNASDNHLMSAIHDSPFVRSSALRNPNIKSKHLSEFIKKGDTNDLVRTIDHPEFKAKHISEILANKDNNKNISADIKKTALAHGLSNSDHLTQALQPDQPKSVRKSALLHPETQQHHWEHAAAWDDDKDIRKMAKKLAGT